MLAVGRAAHCRSVWGVLSLVLSTTEMSEPSSATKSRLNQQLFLSFSCFSVRRDQRHDQRSSCRQRYFPAQISLCCCPTAATCNERSRFRRSAAFCFACDAYHSLKSPACVRLSRSRRQLHPKRESQRDVKKAVKRTVADCVAG